MSYASRSPMAFAAPSEGPRARPSTLPGNMQRRSPVGGQGLPSPLRASAVPSAMSSMSGFTGNDGDSDPETEPENTAEPWKQSVGGLVAPRTFAARFFVTRLGFMRRKCRRMMAFTADRLYVVRVEDGRAKASYPIKSVQLAPSDKVNQGKGIILTSEIGNVRHQYKCRDRTSLLAAFYELQDSARDRPLNLLFQVIKRSKTRGDVKMTLRVGPTSLDRVDGERLQHRVSSLPLLSVEKVYLFTDDATQMLVDCLGGRRRRYWCAARDSLVRAMEDHLRKLGRTGDEPLPVARVGTWEVDTSSLNPESVKQGYLFEVPVQKWSRTECAFKNRLLALTKSSVVEMDVATREHLREFPLEVIFNIVYHTPGSAGSVPAEAKGGNGNSIEVQMAWGGSSTYTFQACRCAAVSGDALMAYVVIAEEDVTPDAVRKSEERRFRGSLAADNDNFADGGSAGSDGVCGFYDLRLTAKEARVHFLANFLEMCRLNHHGCPWSLRRVTTESRVGELTGGLHPDYQEFLLKRTTGLSAIARAGPAKVLADAEARAYALAVLDELNASTPVAFMHKEKGAAAAAMSLLSPSALQHFDDSERVCLLLAVLRLLWSKTGYDEVYRAECQPAIDGVFKCLASSDHTVAYPAALVIRSMLTHPRTDSAWSVLGNNGSSGPAEEGLGADRKLEKANRKALFGQGNEKRRLERLLAPCFAECMKPEGAEEDEDFGSELSGSEDEEDEDEDGTGTEDNYPLVTMAGVGPPPKGSDCLVQAVLMEVLVILVSSGDKQADRAVVEAVWELLHEFDAMCRLLTNLRSPCLPLAKASMQLLAKMHHSKRFSVGPRSILQDSARDSGMLLWVMFLAMDSREPDMCRVAGRLCRALTDGDARSLGVLTRSFPPGLLSPCPPDQLFNECGAAVWGTTRQPADALNFHASWGILSQDIRNVEVVWSPRHRDALGRLLLEQLQELERETRRGSARRRGGRAPPEALAWNDAAWEVPWHNMVGEVKVGRYFLEQLIADLDSSTEAAKQIRKRLANPTALGNFLQLCHLRLLHERDASSLELVFDTMTCLFQHLGSRAVPMLPFLGSVLHMLTYSLVALLGPVGAGEEEVVDADDEQEFDKELSSGDASGGDTGVAASAAPRSGAQATATYYAAVQFVRVCMDNQPANVRLFVMHGGVETFVDLIGNAFQHAHSLSASSSSDTNANGVSTTAPSTNVATRTSGSEEDFDAGGGGGAEAGPAATLRNIRRERASDMSVALTCRELVVECISCLSSALEVFPAQDMDGKMFFPKPPPKKQLADPVALAALVDLLASEEEAVLHPALTLLVTVVRGGLEIPLSAGARGRIVVRCLRHACEGRCAELCAELLGAEAVAAPPSRLSDGGMGGAVGPISTPREGAVLARSPLYPLLPGALVRLMVTKGARAFAEALLADGLETPTVVWNSECRHMLGVVLRELEGATPGLQDVPTSEVQEAGRRLEALYSERGGVPVLFTSPYYVQLMDENYRIEYPAAFLLEVASSITEVLQGPPEIMGVRGRGRTRCISTLLENEGDVIYLHEPLVWTLRQHASNGAVGPDALVRAIGAVAIPLLDITARVAVACSHSPEALTSLASFTESLSLALGFLARSNHLTAQTVAGPEGASATNNHNRRVSQGQGGRRSSRDKRRRSSFGGRRRSGGSGENGGGAWNVAIDLGKVDALLTMLKQLDDQESAGHLMNAGNRVLRCLADIDQGLREPRAPDSAEEIPGLVCYVSGLVSSLACLEAPSAVLAATQGIGLAAMGFNSDAHIDLLYKSQVYVPLIAHCVRPQVSEDRPGGNPGLGLESARALAALGSSGHAGVNSALSALLTPGGLACLRRSPDELIRVLRTDVIVETPRLVWGPTCREELEELLKQPMDEPDMGGHRGLGAALPPQHMLPGARRCRRFKPRELDGFVFPSLQDELVVDDVYLRVLVRDALRSRGVGTEKVVAGSGTGLGQGLALPGDLLASVFVYLGDQMRLIVAGQIPNVTSDRQLFFQDVSLLLQALLGLAVGEEQVPEVIEDSGDALHLLWAATSPYLRDGTAGLAEPTIARSVVQLMHAFMEHGGPNAGEALVASGAVAPAVHACGKMLLNDYDHSVYTEEDGVAALHVSAMLLDAHPHATFHMLSIGAVPLFVSRGCSGSLPRSTRLRCLAILHRLCVTLPAASIALGRVMPEVLLMHLENDATGESLLNRLDDDAVSPILIWDESCRDRLSVLTWEHWDDWSKRVKLGASLRWLPVYLAEEVLLPEAYATEPCVAGLYFSLYAKEPGFALEKDMVEGFLVCSVEAMLHGRVADELLPVLLEALYYGLASLGDGALASASRKASGLWPIVFSLIWKELGLGQVRYDPAVRPRRGVETGAIDGSISEGDGPAERELSQGEAILRWGARIVCVLASVPVHWTVAGAGAQIVSDEHALALVHSPALDEQCLWLFVVTARAVVASKTDEGMDVARHFVSPLVLRSLVDRLASYKPQKVIVSSPVSVRVGKYGMEPGASSAPPSVMVDPDDDTLPPTVTEDLVVKLLACLMVHPQQGQRARLVLRDELPEALYMSLHQAGSIPADIHSDSVTALPSLPDRDTDHKVYPKKGNAGAGAAGAARSALATGNAKAPDSLAVPLSIVVTSPVEGYDEAEDAFEEEAVQFPAPGGSREMSLKRSVAAALSPFPRSVLDNSSPMPSLISAGGDTTPGSRVSGRERGGLWQRASAGWSTSSPNTPGNRSSTTTPTTAEVSEENRPMTLPSPQITRGRSLSFKKASSKGTSPKRGGDRSSTVSPKGPARHSVINWAAVGRALSPGLPRPEPESGES